MKGADWLEGRPIQVGFKARATAWIHGRPHPTGTFTRSSGPSARPRMPAVTLSLSPHKFRRRSSGGSIPHVRFHFFLFPQNGHNHRNAPAILPNSLLTLFLPLNWKAVAFRLSTSRSPSAHQAAGREMYQQPGDPEDCDCPVLPVGPLTEPPLVA